jgi:integrase
MKGHLRARDRRKVGGKKKPCNTWQLVVEGERDADGKRLQHYRSFRGDRAEADRALRQFLSELETGYVGDGDRLTVAEFVEQWLLHTATRVRASTVARYRQLLERRVVPAVGSLKLRELRPMHIQRLYDVALHSGNDRKNKTALSGRTVVHLHRVLYAAMKQARQWGLIVANPCESVEPPRPVNREMRALNVDEARKLVDAARGTRLLTPIILTLAGGFRRGEVLALSWDSIDFERSTVRVARSLNPDGSFSEPKTARGRRAVGLPPFAFAALRSLKVIQNQERLAAGPAYDDRGLVFADPLGGAWKPASISTLFHAICKRAGIGHVRFHDLRHTAASLLIERGVPITAVAALLGHANTSTTLTTYAHAIKGSEDAASRAMEGVFGNLGSAG